MKRLGWIEDLPILIGVQAVSHSPIYTDVTGERPALRAKKTIAGGIAIQKPARLGQVAFAIRATGGTVVVVDDDEIRRAQKALARRGFLVEPTSAAAFAGYGAFRQRATPDEEQRFLVPLTGSGLKDPSSLEALAGSDEV
jgi:threonine synthase